MGDNAIHKSIDGVHVLEAPIVISEAPGLSPLLRDTSRLLLDADANDGFPAESNCRYAVFRFEPDGSTDLPAWPLDNEDEQWFVTLVQENDVPTPAPGETPSADEDLVVPPDFVVVQVDPLTGQVRTLRP